MLPTLPKKKLLGVVAVLTIGLGALFPALGLYTLMQITFVVGFLILLPLIGILGEDFPLVESTSESISTNTTDPIEQLRNRYATGEVSAEEFERRLDRLLETEDLTRESNDEAERVREFDVE